MRQRRAGAHAVNGFLDVIAAAPASELPRHEARLESAIRLESFDQFTARLLTAAIAKRRSELDDDDAIAIVLAHYLLTEE